MDGAIVDKIIANFEGKPFDEKAGTEPGLITKQNVPNPEGLQVLSTDLYGPKGQESLAQVLPWVSQKRLRATGSKCPNSGTLWVILWQV